MHNDWLFEDLHSVRAARRRVGNPTHVVLVAILTILVSTALCVCAILAHAPAMALPMIVAVCVGCPLFAGWNLPIALDSLRADRAGQQALRRLRRGLAALPEIEHPLGF